VPSPLFCRLSALQAVEHTVQCNAVQCSAVQCWGPCIAAQQNPVCRTEGLKLHFLSCHFLAEFKQSTSGKRFKKPNEHCCGAFEISSVSAFVWLIFA